MERFLAVVLLCGAVLASAPFTSVLAQQDQGANAFTSDAATAKLPPLPSVPGGESTVLGGAIRRVDPVQDRFQLKAFGERPLTILYDERTQAYRDGKKISLRQLGPEDHASVQTVLDGGKIFAISIHILSQTPEGETQGRVLSYDPATGELRLRSNLSPAAVRFFVTHSTSVVREGQPSFISAGSGPADLVPGSLIGVRFATDSEGRSVADRIAVLAVPGFTFLFAGNISSLNMGAGLLDIVDAKDDQSYQIHFDPSTIPPSQNLHPGQRVRVAATFDGTRYSATGITIE
jgi:hypothetical protein